jgi:hypothetical protein
MRLGCSLIASDELNETELHEVTWLRDEHAALRWPQRPRWNLPLLQMTSQSKCQAWLLSRADFYCV